MHTDDHILQSFLGAKGPLPIIALDLGMTLIALVQWVDRNADLLAVAKRAMETHIAFLALRAEAAALIDLTQVSTSTINEERKRRSASQLLRHSAKRLLPQRARSVSDGPSADALASLAGSLERSAPHHSPRQVGGGEKSPSEAKGMRGVPISPSVDPASLHNLVASGVPPVPTSSATNPPRERRAPCVPDPAATPLTLSATSSLDASMPPPSLPSSSTNPERKLRASYGSESSPDLLHQLASDSFPNASSSPTAPQLNFSDHEIDVLMATLARHFDIDLSSDTPDPAPA